MTEPTTPPGYADTEERNWAVLTHVLAAVGVFFSGMAGWVMPLVTYATKGNQSPTLRAHAVSALNFNITWAAIDLVVVVLSNCLGLFGFPGWLLYVVFVVPIVFNVIAAVKANDGVQYRHPLSYPVVK
ncbi:DUF4870 domain-containing protein [Actinocatenispora rupis]|uniref:Orotate phosphoribosyltransferase n=1 Tax=Actinocatenispora rupis TaxID=519421 RepID=A0A8J3JH57_9ACTN|nr:DUF4870 domain-containing protein [Actinocatenispora rupis]GID14823.1 orotate phosphoribosyltransferase [Actinocatenispora rupis]